MQGQTKHITRYEQEDPQSQAGSGLIEIKSIIFLKGPPSQYWPQMRVKSSINPNVLIFAVVAFKLRI